MRKFECTKCCYCGLDIGTRYQQNIKHIFAKELSIAEIEHHACTGEEENAVQCEHISECWGELENG